MQTGKKCIILRDILNIKAMIHRKDPTFIAFLELYKCC